VPCGQRPLRRRLCLQPMPFFLLHPKSRSNGMFAAALIDDEACLWDDPRLRLGAEIGSSWQMPHLSLVQAGRRATSVLFNPNAIVVSEGVRDELSMFPELEFLPVDVRGHGVFFILHVVATVELPVDARAKFTPAPGGNLFTVEAFPAAFDPPFAFFRVLHPMGAAARRPGGVARAVYLTASAAERVHGCAGEFLEARPLPSK